MTRALEVMLRQARERALEEAAMACEARAVGPSSLDYEARMCAAAIRKLKLKTAEEANNV